MRKKLSQEKFIERAKQIHEDKYDYSKVEYINIKTKVCIICPEHGEFWQTPNKHLAGQGCKECGKKITKKKLANEEFIEKAKKIHGDKYDYSKTKYVDAKTKVCIICPEHGEFFISPHNHLCGKKCIKCATIERSNKHRNKQEDVIDKAKIVHNNKYDYSKVKYNKMHEKVCIICPEHGEFWQSMANHVSGKGCPACKESFLEREVEKTLLDNNILFETQKQFNWLKIKKPMKLDFYLPDYNVAIECQGLQHFKSIPYFGGDEKFEIRKQRDIIKRKLCEEHGIKILYYTTEKIETDEKITNNLFELLDNIGYEK
jgi:very-short-patch-repair endonuclease